MDFTIPTNVENLAINCTAPAEGTMHLLLMAADERQATGLTRVAGGLVGQ